MKKTLFTKGHKSPFFDEKQTEMQAFLKLIYIYKFI